MQEKVKGFLDKGKQWWSATKKRTKILLSAVLAALVAVIIVASVLSSNQPYVTLFTGLNQTDMATIVTYLSDNGVTDYRISGDDTILVPSEQEAQLKAALLTEGYPSSGFAYSTYFDHVGSLTTEAERNQLVLYELQDRTAAVIRSMEGVKDAVVQFTPGEDRTYVLDSGNVVEAQATATVTMRDGQPLNDTLASGIRNLLSRSLQGLKVENVTILDSYGNTYTPNDTLSQIQDTSMLKMQLEEQVNNKVRSEVMKALLPIYGEGNVEVSVNSVVDVDRTYTDSTDYNLEDWADDGSTNGEGIIGSKVYENEILVNGDAPAGGQVGTTTNADIPTYPEDETELADGQQILSTSGEKDYLVDTTQQQVEHTAGYVSDLMVSVTVNASAGSTVGEDELYPHVARAAGIAVADQRDKIHVLITPFYEESENGGTLPAPENIPMWMLYAAAGGVCLFIILLIVILALRRRSRKKRAAAEEAAALAAAQQGQAAARQVPPEPTEGANIMEMQTEKSMELRKDVRKFAEDNPEIAAQMVKAWLREGDSVE